MEKNYGMTIRSKTTGKTATEEFRVWPGQVVQDIAARIAKGYGAIVESIYDPETHSTIGPVIEPYFVINNGPSDVVMQDIAVWDATNNQYKGGYSGRTLEEFIFECGPNVSIMGFDEGYALYEAAQEAKYIGPVKEITQERFEYLLECLPPVNWIRINGTESFKFMERLSGDITYIVARVGGSFYEFNDKISLSHDVIIAKISKAIADGSLIRLV